MTVLTNNSLAKTPHAVKAAEKAANYRNVRNYEIMVGLIPNVLDINSFLKFIIGECNSIYNMCLILKDFEIIGQMLMFVLEQMIKFNDSITEEVMKLIEKNFEIHCNIIDYDAEITQNILRCVVDLHEKVLTRPKHIVQYMNFLMKYSKTNIYYIIELLIVHAFETNNESAGRQIDSYIPDNRGLLCLIKTLTDYNYRLIEVIIKLINIDEKKVKIYFPNMYLYTMKCTNKYNNGKYYLDKKLTYILDDFLNAFINIKED